MKAAVALAPATTRLLLLSGSVANPGEVAAWLRRLGRPVRVVETSERPVPLDEVAVEAFGIAIEQGLHVARRRLPGGGARLHPVRFIKVVRRRRYRRWQWP